MIYHSMMDGRKNKEDPHDEELEEIPVGAGRRHTMSSDAMSGIVESIMASDNIINIPALVNKEEKSKRNKGVDEAKIMANKEKGGENSPNRKGLILARLDTSKEEDIREANVQIMTLSIVCPGRPEIELSHPFISSPKDCLFTLKEGTKYRLKFSFRVSNKVVSGLKYENTLWKAGVRVDRSTVVLGNFRPHDKPYGYQLEEETLPCGMLVRGLYSARAKVTDDDGTCYMDIQYHFDIKKTWP
ncbi:Immunoglobulin E-set superfamily protein isoform 1 [Dorcoceras hygrometricum]|uniref:Immunoglobulin E-set superfamily protein isoform 1 n=1 Tax=Dorcoceras hygrometricum TaxID=472368 RepID=A0A2Z7AUH7_9LAMI|nr:Immunoglobulin E-set superfamily protein isoform 1 [Dorcoceras hygrometricum]